MFRSKHFLFAAALILNSCDKQKDSPPPAPQQQSENCGSKDTEVGLLHKDLRVRGKKRTYLLSVSNDYKPWIPHRLIFSWHGFGLSGSQMHDFVDPIEKLSTNTLFVYPDTAIDGATRGLDGSAGGQDVAFFDAMLQTIGSDYCLDQKHIFSIGFSDGAFFTNALAQSRAQVLRGIIAIAGGGGGGKPVTAMIIHSREDGTVGFENGLNSVRAWADSSGCKKENFNDYPTGACSALKECNPAFPVIFCPWGPTKNGQGTHDWPRFPSANEDIRKFLASP